jgi:hypothetical protein
LRGCLGHKSVLVVTLFYNRVAAEKSSGSSTLTSPECYHNRLKLDLWGPFKDG